MAASKHIAFKIIVLRISALLVAAVSLGMGLAAETQAQQAAATQRTITNQRTPKSPSIYRARGPAGMPTPGERSVALRPPALPTAEPVPTEPQPINPLRARKIEVTQQEIQNPVQPQGQPQAQPRQDNQVLTATFSRAENVAQQEVLIQEIIEQAAAANASSNDLMSAAQTELQQTTMAASPSDNLASETKENIDDKERRRLGAPSAKLKVAQAPAKSESLIDMSWAKSASGWMSSNSIGATLAASALAIGLFLLAVAVLKRAMPRSAQALPKEVVTVVGRVPMANRQVAQLIKLGNKLVLVCVTAEGMKPLAEISDPEEVGRLLGLVEQANPHSATAAFAEVFNQIASEPVSPGFLGNESQAYAHAAHGGSPTAPTGGTPMMDRASLAAAYAKTPGGRTFG